MSTVLCFNCYQVLNLYSKLCITSTIVLVHSGNCHLSLYFSAFAIVKQIMGMVHWILLTLNTELVSVDIGYKIFLCALFFGGHKMQLRTKKSYFKIKRIIYYVQADWLAECKKSNHYQKVLKWVWEWISTSKVQNISLSFVKHGK